jgi:hypothetical protein
MRACYQYAVHVELGRDAQGHLGRPGHLEGPDEGLDVEPDGARVPRTRAVALERARGQPPALQLGHPSWRYRLPLTESLEDLGFLNSQPGAGVADSAVSLGRVVELALVELAGLVAAGREPDDAAKGSTACPGHGRESTPLST